MSQYLNIFLKNKDEFIELMDYCRSSDFYQIVNDAINPPYEKIQKITKGDFLEIYKEINNKLTFFHSGKVRTMNLIDSISSWNNSIDEKTEVLYNYQEELESYNESIEDIKRVKAEVEFYEMISQNRRWLDDGEEDTIYMGIEIGNPTVEDVV